MLRTLLLLPIVLAFSCKKNGGKESELTNVSPVMCAPVTSDSAWYNDQNVAPLFEGLGDFHFTIKSENALVQQYFDQGFMLAYGFNHAEAARSFYYASTLDSACAMAYWGFAYVLGPNYNAGMEPDHYERAYRAIQKAIALSEKAGIEKEKDLILALSKRYAEAPVEDRYPLDEAYAKEMKELYLKYPEDPDVAALYAESLMNLHPWDLWTADGQAKEWTPEILTVLENIFIIAPRHPGANHFYIHAVEASRTPEKGLKSAQLFDEGLVPNAGHLVHMPSHIYIRTGDYHKGTLANIHAITVDSQYVTACHAQGAYPLAYYPHNQHFLAATATLEGNSQWAIFAADAIAAHVNRSLMHEPGWGTIQHYYTIPYFVYVKFGKWDEILHLKNDVSDLVYPEAIFTYARGMAFLGKGDLVKAKEALNQLASLASNQELHEITIWDINSVYDIVMIAQKVLTAEILATEHQFDQSITLLQEAIAIEDHLNYNEPPDWFFSVRHYLGAIQLEAGKETDAIKTFKEDLVYFPKNGWALNGLAIAYTSIKDTANQQDVERRFKTAWATADITLTGSRVK